MGSVQPSLDDRIQILEFPVALPACCAICQYPGGPGNDGRKFIDFGLSLEFYGAVIFCDHCMSNTARALGFVPASELSQMEDIALDRSKINSEILEENGRLRDAIATLRTIPFVEPKHPSDDLDVPESLVEHGQKKSGPAKSGNGRGSANVSGSDSNESELTDI